MSNMCKNGHKKESGKNKLVTRKTKEDRNTTKKGTKITDAANVEHQTAQDNIYVPPNPLNAETLKREDITKRCAVYLKEYSMWIKQLHQRKKITGTDKSRKQTTAKKTITSMYPYWLTTYQ